MRETETIVRLGKKQEDGRAEEWWSSSPSNYHPHTKATKSQDNNRAAGQRERKLFSQMPYHAVFGFLIPLLVAVLQLYQGTNNNNYSFQAHPANLWVFLLSTSVYCFAFVADIKSNPSYAQRYSLVAVISGSLSSVSLISLFLPDLLGRLIFIPWALVSIAVSRSLIISLCCWLYQMIMKTFCQVVGIWIRFEGSGLMPRLPV